MSKVTALNPNLDAATALRDLAQDMENGAADSCTVIIDGMVYQLGPSRDEAADALWNMALGIKGLLDGD